MKKIRKIFRKSDYIKKEILYAMLITFALTFAIKCFFCLSALPVRTLSDELATISGAAYWAGYDWSSVVSNAGYYGVGFTSLLSIFFYIFENPIYIYRAMLITCAFLQSLAAILVFYVCVHYCKFKNILMISLIALSSSFFVATRATIVYNEHMLILISWICMLLLLKLIEYANDKRRKRWYTFVLMICLGYSLTIHTRSLVLWFALTITVAFWGWVKKQWLISPIIAAATGTFGYIISQFYIKSMQAEIWRASEGRALRNASIPVPEVNLDLFSVDKWQAWLNIVLGQFNTINIFSGGLVVFFLIFFLHLLWKVFIKDKKFTSEFENNGLLIFVPIIVFFLLCVSMTIFAQSFTWLPGAAESLAEGIYNMNYGTKAFTYIRYMSPYCGPLFMVGCIWLYTVMAQKNIVMIYYKVALAVLIAISVYWIACIVPYIHQTTSTGVLEVLIPFSLSTVEIQHARLAVILPASIVVVILFICYGILIKKNKISLILSIISILLVYQYSYNAVNWDFPTQKNNFYNIGFDIEHYISKIEDEVCLPNKIYVQDIRDITDHYMFYEIQFLLFDYRVIPLEEACSIDDSNFVLITNEWDFGKINEWIERGCKYVQIDKYYIIIGGSDLQNQFKDCDINLSEDFL